MTLQSRRFWAKYQGYDNTFVPNIALRRHCLICNQNDYILMLVNFGQSVKTIALFFDKKRLIFITFPSGIKIHECQFLSFFCKLQRLYAYSIAKNG